MLEERQVRQRELRGSKSSSYYPRVSNLSTRPKCFPVILSTAQAKVATILAHSAYHRWEWQCHSSTPTPQRTRQLLNSSSSARCNRNQQITCREIRLSHPNMIRCTRLKCRGERLRTEASINHRTNDRIADRATSSEKALQSDHQSRPRWS